MGNGVTVAYQIVGYLVGSARVVSQKHPLFDPAISGHSRHVCKTPSLGESAVRLRLSDPSLKRRWRVKLRSSAGLRRLQYLNPPMNALCYRLPIAHSPAGDPLTTAAAVQGRSRSWLRTVRPLSHPARSGPSDLYARERFMNWGNFVRSSAIAIGLAAVVVAAIYLATRFLLLLEGVVAQ